MERFLQYAVRVENSECWAWSGFVAPNGYAQLGQRGAHRVAYELLVGPIPHGLQIDHLCRNRGCVNPQHMEPVTIKTNVLRGIGITAVHAKQTHCKHGHEFTPENTRYDAKGSRCCRACAREWASADTLRAKAAISAEVAAKEAAKKEGKPS